MLARQFSMISWQQSPNVLRTGQEQSPNVLLTGQAQASQLVLDEDEYLMSHGFLSSEDSCISLFPDFLGCE